MVYVEKPDVELSPLLFRLTSKAVKWLPEPPGANVGIAVEDSSFSC